MNLEMTVAEVAEIFKEIQKQPERLFEMIRGDIRETVGQYLTGGLKLRVAALEVEKEDVASWGGSPVTMAYAEVYTALQQGTIDGVGIGLSVN